MSWIKQIITLTHHPIIDLLLLRNELEDEWKKEEQPCHYEDFLTLPVLDRIQIMTIEAKLAEGNSIFASFENFYNKFKWNEDSYAFFVTKIEGVAIRSKYTIVVCLYHILMYIVTPNITKTSDTFIYLFKGLICLCFGEYNHIVNSIAGYLLDDYLSDATLEWNDMSIIIAFQFFSLNESLNEDFSPLLMRLIKKAERLKINEINVAILDMINILLSRSSPVIQKDDRYRIISIIDPFIKEMNVLAYKIIVELSLIENSQPVKDCFVSIPSIIIEKVIRCPLIIHTSMMKSDEPAFEISEKLNSPGNQIFHVNNDSDFENGFQHINLSKYSNIMTFKQLIDPNLYGVIVQLSTILEKADTLCIDRFFSSFGRIIMALSDQEKVFDCISCFLFFLTALSNMVSITPIQDVLMSSIIFDASSTIFSQNGISSQLNSLRHYVLTMFYLNAPSYLSDLISASALYPFMVAEIVSRIMNHQVSINPRVFTTEPSVRSFSIVIRSLQLYRTQGIIGSDIAFHSSLWFLFFILQDFSAAQDCFSINEFVEMFLSLTYETGLSLSVLLTLRSFLIISPPYNLVSLSQILNIMYDSFPKAETKDLANKLAVDIANCLLDSISHNSKIAFVLGDTLDCILGYSLLCPDSAILLVLLKFFSLVSQTFPTYPLTTFRIKGLIDLVQKIEGKEPQNGIYLALLNIIAGSISNTKDTLFIIKYPIFIPIILGCFGESSIINEILEYFLSLCRFSPSNSIALHYSGIDSILLDYIHSCFSGNRIVMYRGCSIVLQMSHECINEIVIPLLGMITQEVSNNSIALQYINLIRNNPTSQIGSLMLNNHLSDMSYRMKDSFAPCQLTPFCSLTAISPSFFNRMFSFCMWMKIDQPISLINGSLIHIMKITSSDGSFFEFYLHRAAFYFKFESQTVKHNIRMVNAPAINKWVFFSLLCQRSSLENSSIALFMKNEFSYCSEVKAMAFSTESSLSIDIGGDNNQSNDVICGPFGFHEKVLSEETLCLYENQGPSVFTTSRGFIFHSSLFNSQENISFLINNEHNDFPISVYFAQYYSNSQSLSSVLGRCNHLLSLSECFDSSSLFQNGLFEQIISIMKLVFQECKDTQNHFLGFSLVSYSLVNHPEFLSYQLYLAFFSIYDVLTKDEACIDLFDNMIVNPDLWKLSPTTGFQRVVNHWNHSIPTQCSSMLKRKQYFSRVFIPFFEIFAPFSKDYMGHHGKKCRDLYFGFLKQIALMNLYYKDIDIIISYLMKSAQISESESRDFFVVIGIQLLILISPQFSQLSFSLSPSIVLSLLEIDSMIITINVLICIHEIKKPHLSTSLIASMIQLGMIRDKQAIFDEILKIISQYPGLYIAASVLALSLSIEDKEVCAGALKGVSDLSTNWINDDNLWYLCPVLIAIQLSGEALSSICSFFAQVIIQSQDSLIELDNVLNLLDYLGFVLHHDFYPISTIIINELYKRNPIFITKFELIIRLYRFFFIRFSNFSISNDIIETFVASPFFSIDVLSSYNCQTYNINSILVFDQLLTIDISQCDFRIGTTIFDVSSSSYFSSLVQSREILNNDSHSFPYLLQLFDFYVLKNILSIEEKNKLILLASNSLNDLRNQISQNCLNSIFKLQEHLKKQMKIIKNMIITDFDGFISGLSNMYIIKGKGNLLQQKSAFEQLQLYRLYSDIGNSHDYTFQYGSQLCFGFSPALKTTIKLSHQSFNNNQEVLFNVQNVTCNDFSILSLPAIRLNLGIRSQTCLFFSTDRIQIVSETDQTISLLAKDIDFVLTRTDTIIEIFAKNRESYYLDFDPVLSNTVIGYISALDNRFFFSSNRTFENVFENQSSYSNYETIFLYELFNGKSVHDNEILPCLPFSHDSLLPFKHFVQYENLDEFLIAFHNRKSLESFDLTSYLSSTYPSFPIYERIIQKQYLGVFTSYGLGFDPETIQSVHFGKGLMILFNDNTYKVNRYTESGVTLDFQGLIENNDISHIYYFDDLIYMFSTSFKMATRISKTSTKVTNNLESFSDIIIDGNVILQVNCECEIFHYSVVDFPFDGKLLALSKKPILSIALSSKFGIFAFGTNNCQLFVHSLFNHSYSSIFHLDGEEAHKILITDSWGLIIVDTQYKIHIFSPNGIIIGSISNHSTSWTKYSLYDGFDYVCFSDTLNNIHLFNACDPNSQKIIYQSDSRILALSYYYNSNCIAAVTQRGVILLIPIPK